MHAQPPQQAGGANPALPLFPRDTDVPRLLPARPRSRPRRTILALINELPQRLGFRQPELGEAEAHFVMKQCLQKSFHLFGEKRVTAVVLAALPHGNERRPQRPLPAFRDDHLTGFREIRHEAADQRELESPRPRARLNEFLAPCTHMVRHRREWLSHPRQSLAIAGFCSEATRISLSPISRPRIPATQRESRPSLKGMTALKSAGRLNCCCCGALTGFLAFTKFDRPPVAGQKIQNFMQRVRYRLALPVAGIMDGDEELQLSLPAHLRPSLDPVREIHRPPPRAWRHKQPVPTSLCNRFRAVRSRLDVPADLASHPAFSSARCILHHMDIERWTREKFAFFLYPHNFTPSSRPLRLGA